MQSSFAVPEAPTLACSLLSSPALLCSPPACVQGKPQLYPPQPAMASPCKLPTHRRLTLYVPPYWSQSSE